MGIVIKSKKITVTTAGTPVALPCVANVVGLTIQAQTNTIWVGDSTVLASGLVGQLLTASSHDTYVLQLQVAGSIAMETIFLDTGTSGSTANVNYFVRV